jgi:hypothetical protein
MAQVRTSIVLQQAGVPLVGAEIIVDNEVGMAMTTDEDGRVQFGIEEGRVAFVQVYITIPPSLAAISLLRLTAGESHLIEL